MAPEDVIKVSYPRLAPETLRAVIEEFVTRDTTDYGVCEKTLEAKVADVLRQLERGKRRLSLRPRTWGLRATHAERVASRFIPAMTLLLRAFAPTQSTAGPVR